MKKTALIGILIAQTYLATQVLAQEEAVPEQPTLPSAMSYDLPEKAVKATPVAALQVRLGGIADGKPIDSRFAYCAPDGKGGTRDGMNISPAINWSAGPAGTKSYTLIMVDKDVPASFENANKAGKEIAVNTPRQNFYHWVLADIPTATMGLLEGKASKGITPGGKPTGRTAYGTNGRNDYVKVFGGTFGGYDGPCPPWNDLRLHHYHFVVYALDIPSLGLPNTMTGPQAEAAMEGHILGKGEIVGIYSNNTRWIPELRAQQAEQIKINKASDAQQKLTDERTQQLMEIKSRRQEKVTKAPDKAKAVTPDDLIEKAPPAPAAESK